MRSFIYKTSLLTILVFGIVESPLCQGTTVYEIAQFAGKDHLLATRYANQFIDAAIRGKYQEKFFGRNAPITEQNFFTQIPEYLQHLQARDTYRTNGTGLSISFFADETKQRMVDQILVTTRKNTQSNKSELIAVKFRFGNNRGLFVDEFTFLAEDSEEIIILKKGMPCSLLYYLTGEGPSNGCTWIGNKPIAPPSPPSARGKLAEDETTRRRVAKRELKVRNSIQLEQVHLYPNLEELDIDCRYCVDFPPAIMDLVYLKKLRINAGQLYGLPDNFTKLDSLKYLHIRSSWTLPEIKGLEMLEELSLNLVYHQDLPAFIFELPNLKILSFEEMFDINVLKTFEGKAIENLDLLKLTRSNLPPLQAFPGLKGILLYGKGWGRNKYEYDFSSIPATLEKITIHQAKDILPDWVFLTPNLKELELSCDSNTYKIPDNLDQLDIEILRLKGRRYKKIVTPEMLAPLRAKEGLIIEGLN